MGQLTWSAGMIDSVGSVDWGGCLVRLVDQLAGMAELFGLDDGIGAFVLQIQG